MFRPAREVGFEVLQEADRTRSGEGGCQGLHAPSSEFPAWAKGTTVHPVIQAGTLSMVLRASLSFASPSNQGAPSQGSFV